MSELLRIALVNLGARKSRTVLTLLGVGVAVASFIALFTLARGPESNWRNSLRETKVHVVGYQKGVVHISSSRLPIAMLPRIRAVPGVRSADPQLTRFVPAEEEGQQVVLVGMPVDSAFWATVPMRAGRTPKPGETWVVVMGPAVADALGRKVGDTLTLLWRDFTVIGISDHKNPLNAAGILAPIAALQEISHSKATVTAFTVQLDRPDDPAATDAVLARLNAVQPGAVFVRTEDITRSSQVLKLLQAVTWVVSAISIVMGIVVVANTLVMSIAERTREIGILSAIGWSAWRITGLILAEGALIAVIGGGLGLGAGIGAAFVLSAMPVLSGLIEPVVSLELIGLVFGVIVAMGLLGGLYPAWLATRVDPSRALQYE